MIEEIKKGFPIIGVMVALLGIAYTAHEATRLHQLATKNELFDSYMKWQSAVFKLRCFYQHKKDKNEFPQEIIDNYPIADKKFEDSKESLKKELALVNKFNRATLSDAIDQRLAWKYDLYLNYRKDLVTIKTYLSDSELMQANRNCNGEI